MAAASRNVFRLLADPTRRALLDLLRGGEKNAQELSGHFRASQQAISLHLQVLRKARVVEVRKQGRYRKYRLLAEPIREVFDWSVKYKPFFDPYGHAWIFTNKPDVEPAGREATGNHPPGRKR
jgi:DNA-binding transcriptional ArsR family regulator